MITFKPHTESSTLPALDPAYPFIEEWVRDLLVACDIPERPYNPDDDFITWSTRPIENALEAIQVIMESP